MIEVVELRKQYADLVAVGGISFAVAPGEIFGLLGPNGAGKTTTIGCISGLLTPTSGHARILGHDVVRDGVAGAARVGRRASGDRPLRGDVRRSTTWNIWGRGTGPAESGAGGARIGDVARA